LRLRFRGFVTSIFVALRHLTWDTSGVVTRAAIKFGQILGDFDLAVQVLRQLDDIHVFVTFDARTEGIRRYSERKLEAIDSVSQTSTLEKSRSSHGCGGRDLLDVLQTRSGGDFY
jgi:hypothetical protein